MTKLGVRDFGRLLAFYALYINDFGTAKVSELKDFDWYDGFAGLDEEDGLLPVIPKSYQKDAVAFARELFLGTTGNLEKVDALIRQYLVEWDFSRLHSTDKAVLRLGVYSLLFCWDIPPEVTIYQSNDLAVSFGNEDAYRYVNGILHQVKNNFRRNFITNPRKKAFKLKRKKKSE